MGESCAAVDIRPIRSFADLNLLSIANSCFISTKSSQTSSQLQHSAERVAIHLLTGNSRGQCVRSGPTKATRDCVFPACCVIFLQDPSALLLHSSGILEVEASSGEPPAALQTIFNLFVIFMSCSSSRSWASGSRTRLASAFSRLGWSFRLRFNSEPSRSLLASPVS